MAIQIYYHTIRIWEEEKHTIYKPMIFVGTNTSLSLNEIVKGLMKTRFNIFWLCVPLMFVLYPHKNKVDSMCKFLISLHNVHGPFMVTLLNLTLIGIQASYDRACYYIFCVRYMDLMWSWFLWENMYSWCYMDRLVANKSYQKDKSYNEIRLCAQS